MGRDARTEEMSKWQLTPLRLELLTDADGVPLRTRDGRPLFRLSDRYACISAAVAAYRKAAGITDSVPGLIETKAGFVTDLASFPQITLAFFGDTAEGPSVPHDDVYSSGKLPRRVADAMLYELCVASGIHPVKAWLIWAGARIGGRSHYTAAPA